MRIAIFCHSILSDWNHGNAHFLRGVATEFRSRGHEVRICELRDAWSVVNLITDHGETALAGARKAYPGFEIVRYTLDMFDVDAVLDGADLVLVHEWNPLEVIRRVGAHRRRGGRYCLLFHDTHHRSVTEPRFIAGCDLSAYDGVLAFGEVVRERYIAAGWARRAWTWHEAADVRVFRPIHHVTRAGDLVWIGNWGDGERSRELREFLLGPVKALDLRALVHGVRYPVSARRWLARAGLTYGGWLPNSRVPELFGRFRVTVHVPRRPYASRLPGIPTIRPFEALACGIPLICSPWDDVEGLFTTGKDYLLARNGREMTRQIRAVLNDATLARELAEHGRRTILARHTCAHRVTQLLEIYAGITRLPRERTRIA